jgi:DNA-directed RNA polymerase subunit RPC12/RpoP
MKQFKLICAECGASFIEEADYDVPGVQGEVVTSSGIYMRFIDSTEPHYCPDCQYTKLIKIMEQMKGELDV